MTERHGFCHLPVAWDDGEVVGITCVCDLWPAKPHELIIQYMKVPVVAIGAQDTVLRAAELMRERNVGCLPVLDDRRRLCGILTLGDLMRVGAIGVDQLPLACMSCGSRHHVHTGVSRHTASAVSYCVRCLGGGPRGEIVGAPLPKGDPS
jgi:hypothetical protein